MNTNRCRNLTFLSAYGIVHAAMTQRHRRILCWAWLGLFAAASAPGQVVLNEIMADNWTKLDNRGEAIELLKPDPPQPLDRPKPGLVPYILVDRVEYEDRAPWPSTPDGDGDSLQRRSSMVYGNDPVHWLGAPPTAGRANAVEAPRIEAPAKTTNGFVFQFTALAGVPYAAEWRANLSGSSGVALTNIGAAVDTRTVRVTDSAARTNGPPRFYQVRIPAQP